MATFTSTLNLQDETYIVQERSDDGLVSCRWETRDGKILAHLTPEGARRLAEKVYPNIATG